MRVDHRRFVASGIATLLLVLCACVARAESVWLVIGASEKSAAAIARKAKGLSSKWRPEASTKSMIVQMSDCGGSHSMFAWSAAVEPSPETAAATLKRLLPIANDAFVKRCNVVPRSMLSMRLSAVDPSIADVPDQAVNWEDSDRISFVRALAQGPTMVVVRYLAKAGMDDPLQGRRERVMLATSSRKPLTLVEDCPDAGAFIAHSSLIALQCAREQAADNILHEVLFFNLDGAPRGKVERCRTPEFGKMGEPLCMEETVAADGGLVLQARRVTLASPTTR